MRIALAVLFLTGFNALPQATDQSAIRALVQRYMEARNQKDEKLLRGLFTRDADQLVSTGEWRHGEDALVAGALASSRKENGKSSLQIESVRRIGQNAAIADARYETSTTGNVPARRMWSSFVLQKTSFGWRIAAIRNMLPAKP